MSAEKIKIIAHVGDTGIKTEATNSACEKIECKGVVFFLVVKADLKR